MSTVIEAPERKDFTPHPEGTYVAIMRDCYLEERANPWKGMPRDKSDPSKGVDERDTITELTLEFLTEHQVEGKPAFVRYRATASVAENSNLRKFLKSWFPALKDEDFARFDADRLIGKGAYITVAQRPDKKGNIWANVVGAMQPPKGSNLPPIPADFVRREQKQAQAQTVAAEAPIATAPTHVVGDDESMVPF